MVGRPQLLQTLHEIEKMDVDPYAGNLFTYVYETGDTDLREIEHEALNLFYDRNALDFTTFKSAAFFEKGVVKFAKSLANAGDSVLGTLTYGGTESILLAVKSARDSFRKRNGNAAVPELVIPESAHPSWAKAAEYFDLVLKVTKIDPGTKKADLDAFNDAVSEKTALAVASAPNFPYGTIDDVHGMGDITMQRNAPLHVDACVGGFIMPFLEELGEKFPRYDFREEAVTSISMDTHKYGYALKGSSVLLMRSPEMKKFANYVNISWPSYIFVNTSILSSRSVGPMASAWTAINYLGREGYLDLAKKILGARKLILNGMRELGFRPTAPVESTLLSLYNDAVDLFDFVYKMQKKSWHVDLQKAVPDLVPYNLHFTLSPIHEKVAGRFLTDARNALEMPEDPSFKFALESILKGDVGSLSRIAKEGEINVALMTKLLEIIPEDSAKEIASQIVIEMFR